VAPYHHIAPQNPTRAPGARTGAEATASGQRRDCAAP